MVVQDLIKTVLILQADYLFHNLRQTKRISSRRLRYCTKVIRVQVISSLFTHPVYTLLDKLRNKCSIQRYHNQNMIIAIQIIHSIHKTLRYLIQITPTIILTPDLSLVPVSLLVLWCLISLKKIDKVLLLHSYSPLNIEALVFSPRIHLVHINNPFQIISIHSPLFIRVHLTHHKILPHPYYLHQQVIHSLKKLIIK